MSETTQVSSGLNIEMAGLDVIPESERKGTPSSLFMPWFAANISVLGISWGSWVLGFGLSLTQAILVSVVGVALSFLLCGLIAIAGKRGSAPTLVLSRAAFGYNGNRISAAISWILTVGWETFLAIGSGNRDRHGSAWFQQPPACTDHRLDRRCCPCSGSGHPRI